MAGDDILKSDGMTTAFDAFTALRGGFFTKRRGDGVARADRGSQRGTRHDHPSCTTTAVFDVGGLPLAILALLAAFGPAEAQTKRVKIGVLTDMSSVYADVGGLGSVVAAQMAVDESGLAAQGWTITVVSADHQNKPDVGGAIARGWYDVDGVDVIVDVPNSGVALAVNGITRDKNKVFIDSGAGTPDLTGRACTPNTVHWTYDTYALANSTGTAMTKAGGKDWFFLTADYAFGAALEADTKTAVEAAGGEIVGRIRHPLNTSDFSSYLRQAQSSGASVIGLADAGGDTTTAIKQAAELGLTSTGQKLSALLLFISDVHALGLSAAHGLNLTEMFYWDTNDATRAFADRFAKRMTNGIKPNMVQAGVYSGVLHYLKAVALLGSAADGAAVVTKMKSLPTNDPAYGHGTIRADGRKIHPAYLFEVKSPAESHGPWDYFKLVATIPADQAWRPLGQSTCPLVKPR